MTDPETRMTPEEIESGIAAERAALADTLSQLTDRASLDSLIGDTAGALRGAGAQTGAALNRAAKDHPVALATAGAGLALLAFGAARALSTPKTPDEPEWPSPMAPSAESQPMHQIMGDAEKEESDFAKRYEAVAARLSDGLESLSSEARTRVLRARMKAHAAQRELDAASRTALRKTQSAFDAHPLAFGLGAVAAGAAVAAALPRGRAELRRHKELRDALYQRAADILSEEKRKAMAAMKAAAEAGQNEVRKAASEGLDPDETVSRTIPEAVTRITGAARNAYDAAGKPVATKTSGK